MVSMGVGFARSHKIPFISTFACFLTRAHDQIRMAAIDQSALKICGSHAGISIGQDGPSQMGLEDIAMMCALPKSVVLYPCDAHSTQALVEQMANYTDGISYLRTTREKTPVIYDENQTFTIGGCSVIYSSGSDHVLLVGAGITLHEALKAREQLLQESVSAAVIDLYSIKPLDVATLEWKTRDRGQPPRRSRDRAATAPGRARDRSRRHQLGVSRRASGCAGSRRQRAAAGVCRGVQALKDRQVDRAERMGEA